MLKRLISGMAALLLCTAAAAQQRPTEGKDYLTLNPPQSVEASGKVEVIEFFWYRCPHCYDLEPYLQDWVKKLPGDVSFRQVPAIFSDEWALDARVFYTLETTGDLARVHTGLMNAIHRQGGNRLKGDAYLKWVADWLGKNGVDLAKYDSTLRSFTVETKLKRAVQMTQAYKLDGVPAISIQGRWLVSAAMVGERQAMINVADYLTGEARKRLATK
jgi:protein dithiol oxidoreductase (disulfide-forming)